MRGSAGLATWPCRKSPGWRNGRISCRHFGSQPRRNSWLSNDPLLAQYRGQISRRISIGSSPAGAEVLYRPFHQDQLPWNRLGRTPVDEARVPLGFLEWKIEKAGYHTIRDVGLLPPYVVVRDRAPRVPHQYVLEPLGQQPAGMSRVSLRGPQLLAIAGLEHEAPFEIGDFWIDRLEVTNREFKGFVDAGGYREPNSGSGGSKGASVCCHGARPCTSFATGPGGPVPQDGNLVRIQRGRTTSQSTESAGTRPTRTPSMSTRCSRRYFTGARSLIGGDERGSTITGSIS